LSPKLTWRLRTNTRWPKRSWSYRLCNRRMA